MREKTHRQLYFKHESIDFNVIKFVLKIKLRGVEN